MSSNNPTSDIIEGVLKFSKEEIKGLIYRIQNKDFLFIGRKSTIDKIKRNRYSEEWSLFDKYITSKDLRIIVQIGLTLRNLEDDPDERERVKNILLEKYSGWGLHIAQFVQNGFLSNYIGRIITEHISKNALKEELEDTLRNIDKYVVFIKGQDNVEKIVNTLKTRIQANLPKVLMLYSTGSAIKVAKQIKEDLKKEIENYKVFDTSLEEDKYICSFLRNDNIYREEFGLI